MAETTHDLPHIGRDKIVDQLLDRLCRPDDLREKPTLFTHPGFFGLGGVGKSRLLREVTAQAKSEKLTPYILLIDFDPRAPVQPPASPLQFVQRLIDGLEAIDKTERPFWQRWGRVNPFRECRRLIAESVKAIHQTQTITATGGSVADVSLAMTSGSQQVTPALAHAFAEALQTLHTHGKIAQNYSLSAKSRPLVLLALDTVEAASQEIRRWLVEEMESLWPSNTLRYHVLVTAAGREQMTRLIESELPPLDEAAAGRLLVSYAAQRRREGAALAESDLSLLREPTELRAELIRLGEGIPLLLMLLCDLFVDAPGSFASLGDLPQAQEERIAYVIHHYLTRLSEQATAKGDERLWDRHRLLLAGAIPRRLDGSGLLRSLLTDLPGTPYDAKTNYDDLYSRLARQAFVSDRGRGGLVYHQTVREGVLAHLRDTDLRRWQELHRRAGGWYAGQKNQQESLYHRLQVEPDAVWQEMRTAIEAALAARDWPAAQGLIAAAKESELPPGAAAWLTLYNADLAWGEGNGELAQERLREVTQRTPDQPLQVALAQRLENWFGLTEEPDEENSDTQKPPPGLSIHLYLWWGQQRGYDRIVANALLDLAHSARAQSQYDEARLRFDEALDISQRIGSQQGEANALLGLADSARAQSQYDEARRRYSQALDIYQRIGDQQREAYALKGLAESALAQSQYDEAQSYLANSLVIARAIGIPAAALSWCVVMGQRALDAAEAHAQRKEARQAAAARRLAQQCYAWAGEFMRDPSLPAAGQRYLQSYLSLGLRLEA
jgi:tetratricopeptide (TPR) repeat protein